MKRKLQFLSAAALLAIGNFMQAQDHKHCGTTEAMNEVISHDAAARARLQAISDEAEQLDQQLTQSKLVGNNQVAGTVYTIPVVFHILYQTPTENISNAQVYDAMAILNRDYRKLNADTTSIVPAFKPIAKDVEIEFRLATKDPNGNCTNGIIRHLDPNTDWPNLSSAYQYSGTGAGKWNPTKYLNIYVVRTISSGAAGYTYLPGTWSSGSQSDAIVILHDYVGSMGTGSPGTSRALTHEVGHWLNLQHTWGSTNQPGVSCGNDGVTDTPVTKGFTSCNMAATNVCNASVEENIQNYMDYSYCSMMFTAGQATRMRNTVINNTGSVGRANLVSSANLIATGVTNPQVCSPVANFRTSKRITCTNSVVQFYDSTLNAPVTGWQWSFPGGTPATSTDSIPSISYATPGVYAVTYTATNSAGSNSISKTGYITVVSSTASYSGPNTESFETITVPNSEWTIDNPGNVGWTQSSTVGFTGTNSMMINNFANVGGDVDFLYAPSFDLNSIYVSNPPVSFTFKVAYQQKATNNLDKLQVLSSTNCGLTWTSRYSKTGTTLSTAGTGTASFTPTSAQWRTETVNVTPIANQNNVLFKFVFTADAANPGNNVYIDDINIKGATVGIEDNEMENLLNLQVFPNPSKALVNISFDLYQKHFTNLYVTDMLGKVVEKLTSAELSTGTHTYQLAGEKLNAGIYFMNLNIDGHLFTQKIIIE